MGLCWWWVWGDWGAKVDEVWYVIPVLALWVGRDGMSYGRWVVAWGVGNDEGKGKLCLGEWCLVDGAGEYVCFNVWWVIDW